MHEIGALYEIVDTVEKVAKKNKADSVKFITLDIGELSGMMPIFFEKYYPIVIENRPLFTGSELKFKSTPGMGVCRDCGEEYNVRINEGYCPSCGSRDKKILSGLELMIDEVGIS